MVFLKRFHAEGFKSFARPLTLNFNSTMIGIIGPNGSGKSNIVDALRWAMGEQSNKNLRGKEKSNMIFIGSNDMKEADYAFVELVFDNSNRVLHCDSDEVKVSRKLIRKTGETIYMLNDEPCLLKDIHSIFIDSGLAKGSLGLISQGSVNWFAEAKAEDRRQMFESAAGIGKYIKQKEETLKNLESASGNLSQLEQYERSLKREINELNKQVEQAKQYNEKINQLKKYELSVATQDYLTWTDELNELNQTVNSEDECLQKNDIELQRSKLLRDETQTKFYEIDRQIRDSNILKDELSKKINDLMYKKTRYISNLENKISSGTIAERKASYETLIVGESKNLESLKKQYNEANQIAQQLGNLVNELNIKITDSNGEFSKISSLNNEKRIVLESLKNQINTNTSHERGVNELIRAKTRFPGIINTVANLLKVPERYEIAIQTSLGKSATNLVVNSDKDAVEALKFLKENNLGRATFLPINTIKAKEIRSDAYTIISHLPGFIGVANGLVEYDEKYSSVISSLLGNVVIADEINHANNISKMINANYKIITLDGDTVHAGGAISGGQTFTSKTRIFNLEEKLQQAEQEYKEIYEKFVVINTNRERYQNELSSYNIQLQNAKVLVNSLNTQINDSNDKISRFKNELSVLDASTNVDKFETQLQDFEVELIELNSQQQKNNTKLKELEELKQLCHDNLAKYTTEHENYQNEYNSLLRSSSNHKNRLNDLKNWIKNVEERVTSTYSLTMETVVSTYNTPLDITINEAKLIINKLKQEINSLGKINFKALETLNEREKEFEKIDLEHKKAKENVETLIQLVNTLDTQAKSNFMGVIKRVNETLPEVFKSLFGGGTCEIKLTEPNNVLESGIDVIVQLPGKKITNLVLLSGGEKTLIALAVLFSLLRSSKFPLVLLDEAEAALDQANVSTFAKLIKEFSNTCQFIVITHRSGTMKMCDVLYGAMMQVKGVTDIIKTSFDEIKIKEKSGTN